MISGQKVKTFRRAFPKISRFSCYFCEKMCLVLVAKGSFNLLWMDAHDLKVVPILFAFTLLDFPEKILISCFLSVSENVEVRLNFL